MSEFRKRFVDWYNSQGKRFKMLVYPVVKPRPQRVAAGREQFNKKISELLNGKRRRRK